MFKRFSILTCQLTLATLAAAEAVPTEAELNLTPEEAQIYRLLFPDAGTTEQATAQAEQAADVQLERAKDRLPNGAKWFPSAEFGATGGYATNIFQAPAASVNSAIAAGELELSARRTGVARANTQDLYALATHTHYLDVEAAADEAFYLLYAQHEQKVGQTTLGVSGTGFYLDQIAEDLFREQPGGIKTSLWHLDITPHAMWQNGKHGWRLEASAEREGYDDRLLDYWGAGTAAIYDRALAGGTFELETGWDTRWYDVREPRSARGRRSFAGESLTLHRAELEARWRKKVDAWRFKLGLQARRDWDPSGAYNDLMLYRTRTGVDFDRGRWEAEINADCYVYDYLDRLSLRGGETRFRTQFRLNPQLAYHFATHWKFEVEATCMLLSDNNAPANYTTSDFRGGLFYIF